LDTRSHNESKGEYLAETQTVTLRRRLEKVKRAKGQEMSTLKEKVQNSTIGRGQAEKKAKRRGRTEIERCQNPQAKEDELSISPGGTRMVSFMERFGKRGASYLRSLTTFRTIFMAEG
jgi:hypothetical protein